MLRTGEDVSKKYRLAILQAWVESGKVSKIARELGIDRCVAEQVIKEYKESFHVRKDNG